ncbi:hypothetical protein F4779DRAFT_397610 [Xylariaceae sp. FL0662B]|nr:hypothetical protein F4779DRAFT_397610 [Xylariaceae sp. FL0662B]
MYAIITLLSLLTGTATAKTLKYAVPASMAAVANNCVYPADYEVANFTTYTDKVDGSKNTTSFHFTDSDTGIDTSCTSNSTSKPSINGTNRYPCDNPAVAFIYQTTGMAGLTMIETACPGNSSQFEAAGQVSPKLDCTDSDSGSTCVAGESPITGDFTSLEPAPRPPPSR